jgi:hypothetical protein
MPKPVAINPKLTLARKVLAKLRPALLRGVATQARMQVAPATAEAELSKLESSIQGTIEYVLNATQLPVVPHSQPLPETGWAFQALTGQRNAKHGVASSGPLLGFVQGGKLGVMALLLAEAEDATVAAAGEGAHGPDGRLRVSGRTLPDGIIMLPMSSIDTATLKLMEHGDATPFHTRKTGNVLADALRVASGQAEGMVATRLTDLEKLAIDLLVREAGGTCKIMPTTAGETLVAGNLKVVNDLSALLK